MTKSDIIKIGDLGFGRFLKLRAEEEMVFSSLNAGTGAYKAPELALKGEFAYTTDIWQAFNF